MGGGQGGWTTKIMLLHLVPQMCRSRKITPGGPPLFWGHTRLLSVSSTFCHSFSAVLRQEQAGCLSLWSTCVVLTKAGHLLYYQLEAQLKVWHARGLKLPFFPLPMGGCPKFILKTLGCRRFLCLKSIQNIVLWNVSKETNHILNRN